MEKSKLRDDPSQVEPIRERRGATRYAACFPVHLMPLTEDLERLGVSQQVSRTGGLFMTQYKLREGEVIRMRLFVSEDSSRPRLATARVIWANKRTQTNSYWLYDAALRFDQPIDDAEPQVKQLYQKQRRWTGA